MPIYEYECEACRHHFEVRQKFSDPPIETCSQCGQRVKKLISVPGIMFKGTGWYVTDYSNKLKDPASAQRGQDSAQRGGDQAKSDSAPAQRESASPAGASPSSSSSASSGSSPSGSQSAAPSTPRKPAPS